MKVKYCHNCKHFDGFPKDNVVCSECSIVDGHSLWEPKVNPYWERITKLAERQRAKGMSKYGYGLEMNPADILERINHLQEELIDALMYCEWIKEIINAQA